MEKKLFEYVHEILSENEFLIVPNFGAFVVRKNTTFLGDGEYISIIFSAQQQNDDGVLRKYITDNSESTDDDVEEFITSSLENIYETINNTGKFKVDGIGEFRAINDRIVFKADEEQYLKKKTNEVNSRNNESKATEPENTIKEPVQEEVKEPAFIQPEREKVDIEEIRNTYAQKYNAVEESIEETIKELPSQKKEPFDFQKYKIPFLVIVIIILLGSTIYLFKDELTKLSKPIQTNDTTQVATNNNIEQLADTLSEISAVQENNIESAPTESTSPITTENPELSNEAKIETPTSAILYGNNTTTLYYVTKGSFNSRQEAVLEEKNLDLTGFEAKIIETTSGKKYHVVTAEFSEEAAAREELAFAKKIDNSFYLMTVKPNNK